MDASISRSYPELILKDFGLSYEVADTALWQGLNLQLSPATILGISGPNASGKSSLLHAICRVIPEYIKADISGTIHLGDMDLATISLKEIYRYMAVMLSDSSSQLLFPTSELEIAFALENMGIKPLEIRRRIAESLSYFGINHLQARKPQNLSKGEQKLLFLACINAMDSPILLLDEPEAGLSDSALQRFLAWLNLQKQAHKIVLIASHNPDVFMHCDRILRSGA